MSGFMAEANRAYEAGDAETLLRILDEYQDGSRNVFSLSTQTSWAT
jgi:hypothetical protein